MTLSEQEKGTSALTSIMLDIATQIERLKTIKQRERQNVNVCVIFFISLRVPRKPVGRVVITKRVLRWRLTSNALTMFINAVDSVSRETDSQTTDRQTDTTRLVIAMALSVSAYATFMLNISETKPFRGSCPIETL